MGFIMAGIVPLLSASSMYVRCGTEKGSVESECVSEFRSYLGGTHITKTVHYLFERKTRMPDWIVLKVSQVGQCVSS